MKAIITRMLGIGTKIRKWKTVNNMKGSGDGFYIEVDGTEDSKSKVQTTSSRCHVFMLFLK